MTGIEKALHILATEGHAALQCHAQTSNAATVQTVQEVLLAGRSLGLTDLRDPIIFDLFRRVSFEDAASGFAAVLDDQSRVEERALDAQHAYWEARDDYSRNLLITRGYIADMNRAVDRAEYLCGTGINASAYPPSTTKAIDDLINARARLSRSADTARSAELNAMEALHKMAMLQHELAALRVAPGLATDL